MTTGIVMQKAMRIAPTALLLGIVVWWAGPERMIEVLAAARIEWLAAMAGATVVFLVVGGACIALLTRALAPTLDRALVWKSYLRSFAIGMFGPSKLGELTFPYYLAAGGVSKGLGLAVLVADKAITLGILSVLGSLGLATLMGEIQAYTALTMGALALLGTIGLLRSHYARQWVRKRILGSREAEFGGFHSHIVQLLAVHRTMIAGNAVLTVLRMAVLATAVQFGLLAFEIQVEFLSVIAIVSAVQLISWLPITISGIGVSHGSAAFLFSACCGVQEPVVVDLFLFNSLLSYLLAGVVLLCLGYREPVDSIS